MKPAFNLESGATSARSKAAEKKLADNGRLLRAWRRWRRERLEALLAGPYGKSAQALLVFCKTMTGPTALINFVQQGPWREADADVRVEILALVDAVIIERRERMGLPPFDDSLLDRPSNIFLLLREHLFPPDGGANRGEARLQSTSLHEKESTNE